MKTSNLSVNIYKASEKEKDILRNFLALYLHDLSEYTDDLNVDENGFFEYDALDMYYNNDALIPLVFKVGEEHGGFILLNKPPYAPKNVDYNINEFFILKKFRGKGIAREVAKELFKIFPGKYIVIQLKNNTPAIKFWYKVYKDNNLDYRENEIDLSEDNCISQQFEVTV